MLLIRIGSIEKIDLLLRRMGLNPYTIMKYVGWHPAMLRDPEALVSYQRLADLLDICARETGDPVFSMRLTQLQSPLALGELLVASSQQRTIAEAIKFTNEHIHLHARGVRLEMLQFDTRVALSLAFDFTNDTGLEQLIQLSLGQMFKSVEVMVGGGNPMIHIHLRQDIKASYVNELSDYRHSLKVNELFSGISVPKSWLTRPITRDNEQFQSYVEDRVRALENLYPKDLESQVRYLCSAWMATGEAKITNVASALSLHPRVLQNRLQMSGLSFRDLLLDVRYAKAQELLRIDGLSITDIALRLGYAEPSVFSRNFRKWSGESPLNWRRNRVLSG